MTPRIRPFLSRSNLLTAALAVFGFAAGCNAAPNTAKIEWAQEVAPLPAELPSYRLQPMAFSSELIERLKTSAKISDAHKVALDGEIYDADAIGFVQPDTNASLVISSNEGHLVLSDTQAEGDATKDPVSVPSEAEARALADALLPVLGVTPEGLHLRTPGGEPRVLYSKQTQQRARKKPTDPVNPEQVYVRGVRYFQALPGNVAIVGEQARGIDVWFGSEGRITLLSVNWLNAYPDGVYPSASRAELEQRILAGDGTWERPLSQAQTLRVTKQSVIYRDQLKLSGILKPLVLLTIEVEAPAGTSANTFTCSALAP